MNKFIAVVGGGLAGTEAAYQIAKRGKNYYICENNPKTCDFISWNKPKKGEKWEISDNIADTKEKAKTTKKRKTTKTNTAKKKANNKK